MLTQIEISGKMIMQTLFLQENVPLCIETYVICRLIWINYLKVEYLIMLT